MYLLKHLQLGIMSFNNKATTYWTVQIQNISTKQKVHLDIAVLDTC